MTNRKRYARIITDELHTNRKPQCCNTGVSFRREDHSLSFVYSVKQKDQTQAFFHNYHIRIVGEE